METHANSDTMLLAAARPGEGGLLRGRIVAHQSQRTMMKGIELKSNGLLNFPVRLCNLSVSLTCRATHTHARARAHHAALLAHHEFAHHPKGTENRSDRTSFRNNKLRVSLTWSCWVAAFSNASHDRQPRGGVMPRPLSSPRARDASDSAKNIFGFVLV